MASNRKVLGNLGEDVAAAFLEENGHLILERNWRGGHLEIDIISLDKNGVHFVEVKSRTVPCSAEPQENVTPAKQKRLAAASLKYLNSPKSKASGADHEAFFDVITVKFEGEKYEIEYMPQAFIPIFA